MGTRYFFKTNVLIDNREIDAFDEETNDLAILPMFINGRVAAEVRFYLMKIVRGRLSS